MTYPDWFSHYAVKFFDRHLSQLAGREGLRFLQVGVFTGDASVWLLDNILTGAGSLLVDVDTWQGSDEPEHEPFDWADVEATYDGRVNGRTVKHKGTSGQFFADYDGPLFDFIYIDGDHTASTVLDDATAAYRLLNVGGLIAFDDYLWKPSSGSGIPPGVAVDAFAACYADRLDVLEVGLQVWARKVT